MNAYIKTPEIRWSDLDANYHLRHSVYYDWAAYCRISFLNENGISPLWLMQHNIGPIIFREEAIFKREIIFTDTIEINMQLLQCRKDMSRWTIVHEIIKNAETLAATVTVDGAWLDTRLRKLAAPPLQIFEIFDKVPKTEYFKWIAVESKI